MKLQIINSTGKHQFEYNTHDYTLSTLQGGLIAQFKSYNNAIDIMFVAESEAAGICFRMVNRNE